MDSSGRDNSSVQSSTRTRCPDKIELSKMRGSCMEDNFATVKDVPFIFWIHAVACFWGSMDNVKRGECVTKVAESMLNPSVGNPCIFHSVSVEGRIIVEV